MKNPMELDELIRREIWSLNEEVFNAYHGSPYEFDHFDMSKVGSGDGLNKFGYGLYFADREDTAAYYAKELSIGDNRETGFNIYDVRLNGDFYEWEAEIPSHIHDCVATKLRDMGHEDDADMMDQEVEDYGDYWSMRSLYEIMSDTIGGDKNTTALLVSCGVDGVIAQSPAHEGNVLVVYNDQVARIMNTRKLGEMLDLREAEYGEFNTDEFRNMNSFAARKRYADEKLRRMGSGSGRLVYEFGPDKVLKLARNPKGASQNELEIDLGHNDYYAKDYVTEVYEYDEDNNLWLIAERAKKLTQTRFEQLTGVKLGELSVFLRNFESQNNGRGKIFGQDKAIEEAMWENEFSSGIVTFMQNYDMSSGDLGRISSYGEVVRDGQPDVVLTDYGLNKDVWSSHYDRTNEGDANYNDELENFVDTDNLRDGGYAGFALEPNSVSQGGLNSEGVKDTLIGNNKMELPIGKLFSMSKLNEWEDFRTASDLDVKNAVKYIEGLADVGKPLLKDISRLYQNYLIGTQNIERGLEVANDQPSFFQKLMDVQGLLKNIGLIKEDLVYWHSGDAGPESDEYTIGAEVIGEAEAPSSNAFSRNIGDKVAEYVAGQLNLPVPKYMGEGFFGIAYDVGGKVLKVTNDRSEAVDSAAMIGKQSDRIADIYKVYTIDHHEDELYVILLEKLHIPENYTKYHELLDNIFEQEFFMDSYSIFAMYLSNPSYFKELYHDEIIDLLRPHKKLSWFYNEMIAIADEVMKKRLKTADFISPQNVGLKNGKLAFFDLGGAGAKEFKKQPKTMKVEDGTALYRDEHGTIQPSDSNSLNEDSTVVSKEDEKKLEDMFKDFVAILSCPCSKPILDKFGFEYVEGVGEWGKEKEESLIVKKHESLDPKEFFAIITKLAKKFNQEAFVFGKVGDFKIYHLDGEKEDIGSEVSFVNEDRIKTWMPGMTTPKIKKSCRLGGKKDGTSDDCSQGDTGAVSYEKIKDGQSHKPNTANVADEKKWFEENALVEEEIEERVKSFMPGSKAVSVKKKCRLGGRVMVLLLLVIKETLKTLNKNQ